MAASLTAALLLWSGASAQESLLAPPPKASSTPSPVTAPATNNAAAAAASELPAVPKLPRFDPADVPAPPPIVPAAPPAGSPVALQERQNQAKDDKADKDAPTVEFPRKERFSPSTANPYISGRKGEEDIDFVVRTDLPGMQRLYRRESEKQVFERIRQESNRPGSSSRVYFPEELAVSNENYQPRRFAPNRITAEPCYVAHGRTYFEQLNFDRYGWDMGPLTPVATAAVYYYDLAMMPYHVWSRPLEHIETSAGKCLPGDPVPLLLYPEPFSVTGLAGMFGTYVGGLYIVR